MIKIILINCLIIFLVGCDTFHGVNHYTNKFTPMPDKACLISVVKSIDGVLDVTYSLHEGSRPLTVYGIQNPDKLHTFSYVYRGVKNKIYLVENYKGEVEYSHSYGGLHWVPPKNEVEILYPFFKVIEKKLKLTCGVNIKFNSYCSDYYRCV